MELPWMEEILRNQKGDSGNWLFSIPHGLGGEYEIARRRRHEGDPLVQEVFTNHRCALDTTHPDSDPRA